MNQIKPELIAEKLRQRMYYSPLLGVWHMPHRPDSSAFDPNKWIFKKVRSPTPGEFAPVFLEYVHREIVRALERAETELNTVDINRLEKLLRLYLLPDERCPKGRKQPTNP